MSLSMDARLKVTRLQILQVLSVMLKLRREHQAYHDTEITGEAGIL